MGFKENLLQKIQIVQISRKVCASFGPPGEPGKIDKDAMRSLLEMSPYRYQRERDLDLYIEKIDGGMSQILVLDNELPIYRTTVEDVALRKSPFTREMLNIGNIIKILKDSDVKISRREESVKIVEQASIDRLDLSHDESDIESIAAEGAASLENGYLEGVLESLTLFAELLGYQPPPAAFRIRHHEILGAVAETSGADIRYGPAVILSRIDNSLSVIEEAISSLDSAKIEYFHQVAQGKEKPGIEGADVFNYLKNAVLVADSS
ncbi:MAG: hypothetical protein JRF72_20250 [Deltaproteobacteria bacterium]|jgi:hypothetical protein|nr:hypothetical protein [Deltaproteobacteria bacterium]